MFLYFGWLSLSICCGKPAIGQPLLDSKILSELKSNWFQGFTNMSKPSNYLDVTNWGPSVCACQLSIGLRTNIFIPGTVATLHEWIRNSSANKVWVVRQSWNLFLTNDLGKKYLIGLPSGTTVSMPRRSDAYPGEFIVDDGGVVFGADIEPGDYMLQFTRDLEADSGRKFTLVSNSLKIKIIAASSP